MSEQQRVEFVDVVPEVGERVGLVARRGLVGRGVVVEASRACLSGLGRTVVVLLDERKLRLHFEREGSGGGWAHRRLGRAQFRSVRIVKEPGEDAPRAPLRAFRSKLGRKRSLGTRGGAE